jgi:hypothetical protein
MGIKNRTAMARDHQEWRKTVIRAKGPQRTVVLEEEEGGGGRRRRKKKKNQAECNRKLILA